MHSDSSPSPDRALDTIIGRRPDFLASVRRRVRCRADAEDVVQTALLRCLEHRHSLRDVNLALPWFRGILANATTDYFRRRASLARALSGLAAQPREADLPQDPQLAAPAEPATTLLDQLRPEYRQALATVYLEAGRLPDLAEQAGITINNAAVRVFRARQAIRKLAQQQRGSRTTAAAA